jgi:aspartate carbamoyltransferase regulatory subunit
MKFFAASARPKAKTGPVIKRLLVRCPSTSRLTETGQTVEEQRWEATKVKSQKFNCSHCGQTHTWGKKDVVLAR